MSHVFAGECRGSKLLQLSHEPLFVRLCNSSLHWNQYFSQWPIGDINQNSLVGELDSCPRNIFPPTRPCVGCTWFVAEMLSSNDMSPRSLISYSHSSHLCLQVRLLHRCCPSVEHITWSTLPKLPHRGSSVFSVLSHWVFSDHGRPFLSLTFVSFPCPSS